MTRSDEVMLIASVGDNDGMMAPLSRLRSINGGTGTVVLTFDSGASSESQLVETVTLACQADEFEAVKNVTRVLNNAGRNTQSNVVILAASSQSSPIEGITGCNTIA